MTKVTPSSLMGKKRRGEKIEAVSVSMDEMVYHTQAVRNGAGESMVVSTLPFGSYETEDQAVQNAVRMMKEGKADGVHLEGTRDDAARLQLLIQVSPWLPMSE